MVDLNDPPLFERGTPRYQVGLIAIGQAHGDSQGNNAEFPGAKGNILCGTQVDPVPHRQLFQPYQVGIVIFDQNFHGSLLVYGYSWVKLS